MLGRIGRGEDIVHLEPRMMELLLFLAQHPGEVVGKNEIIDSVWDQQIVANSALTRCLTLLRQALGDDARNPTYIETIPKRGYRLIAEVEGLAPAEEGGRRQPSKFCVQVGERVILLLQGENLIGRAPDVTVVVDSPKVSRHHARILVDGDTATLEDIGSKNGTYLRREKLTKPAVLADHDEIVVGSIAVHFFEPKEGLETETAPSDENPGGGER
jgi:DNA-binding winged helix-turn-helix (wHTH) protein